MATADQTNGARASAVPKGATKPRSSTAPAASGAKGPASAPSDEARAVAISFPGASLRVAADHLLLESGAALAIVSSAPYGGGWLRAKRILGAHVPKDVDCSDPEALLERHAAKLRVAKPFVGLLTALDLRRAAVVERAHEGVAALVIVTAGLGNASNAARPRVAAARAGTVNTIILVDAQPAPGALVNAVLTATEAKAFALMEAGVRTAGGLPATGTSTDAIVIGATMRGAPLPYAGPATALGALIGAAVYEATALALRGAARPAPRSAGGNA